MVTSDNESSSKNIKPHADRTLKFVEKVSLRTHGNDFSPSITEQAQLQHNFLFFFLVID